MSAKKRLLFVGIGMYRGGTEKAFLSLADQIDYDAYDVDLLLAKKEGPLLGDIPPSINIYEMPDFGGMFLLSAANSYKTIAEQVIKKHPSSLFRGFAYFVRLVFDRKRRQSVATRMWIDLMRRYAPEFDNGDYDAVISFWGDRAMFYAADKVRNAAKHITWLHFDYGNPPRDNEIYRPYYERCAHVVTVSPSVDEALKKALPGISGRCVSMENIIDSARIRTFALKGESFPDEGYGGVRIVSVCRLMPQKGLDMIPAVLARLREDGCDVRWYVIGDGEEDYKMKLVESALSHGVADIFLLLGAKDNPYGFLRDADIFALTSRFEGRPVTVEEAKIMMRPILATDYVSARDQLENGKYGVIVPISEDGIYGGLKKMIGSEELRDGFTMELSRHDFGTTGNIVQFYRLIDE